MTNLRQAVISYLHRYAVAIGQLRRIRMVPQNVAFDEAYAFAEVDIGIAQKREEVQCPFELVREARPRVVLEIGLDSGGTFFLWSRAAASDPHLLAIDTRRPGRLGGWSAFPDPVLGNDAEGQQIQL